MINEMILLQIIFYPLFGSILSFFFFKIIKYKKSYFFSIFGVFISFILSCYILFNVFNGLYFNKCVYKWIIIDNKNFDIGFLIDRLSSIMMFIITFISFIVNIYSIEYMKEDKSCIRFFSYISLFTSSMLILVMSNNFTQFFFGWELVGFISYLLIGFYFKKENAINANFKAFVVNRIGDVFFILGIGLIFIYARSLNFVDIFYKSYSLSKLTFNYLDIKILTVICLCLFIASMSKSAQFPLHIWLPDSMEGPTPVSALIHSATMVTAGIFLIIRMYPLFELSKVSLLFITIIGSITTFFMGILCLFQNDIKRIIAYSTISQLGYMTVALGVSAYSSSFFHLITHAFFKSLLFLSSGSIIISLNHIQDIRYMGGLYKYLPITSIMFLISLLSLIGTPFFSGFYSKESIIHFVKKSNLMFSNFFYFSVVFSVFVTTLYSFRMYFNVFYGNENFRKIKKFSIIKNNKYINSPRENSFIILISLFLLAIPSVFIGGFLIHFIFNYDFLKNGIVFTNIIYSLKNNFNYFKESCNFLLMVYKSFFEIQIYLCVFGFFVSWYIYINNKKVLYIFRNIFCNLSIFNSKYIFFKVFNIKYILNFFKIFSYKLWRICDYNIIDGIINNIAYCILNLSKFMSYLQSGYINDYMHLMIIGILVFLILYLF